MYFVDPYYELHVVTAWQTNNCICQIALLIESYKSVIGWTNPVKNFNAIIVDNENYTVMISWDPPDYDGGIPVHYYKLILYDRHSRYGNDCYNFNAV